MESRHRGVVFVDRLNSHILVSSQKLVCLLRLLALRLFGWVLEASRGSAVVLLLLFLRTDVLCLLRVRLLGWGLGRIRLWYFISLFTLATFFDLWLDLLLMNRLLRLELRLNRLSSEGRVLLAMEALLVIRKLLLLLLDVLSLGSFRSIGLLLGLGLGLLLSRLGHRLATIAFLQLLGTWSGRRVFVLLWLLRRSRHELLLSLALGTSYLVGLVANFLSGLLFGALAI